MFQRIVVPVDLSDRNRRACDMASRLVGPADGAVYLVHVIEPIPGLTFEEERPFYRRLESTATDHLAALARPLRERGVAVREEVVYGRRLRTILDEAEKVDADLIVVQSHRVEPDRAGEGLGTLSYQIGALARCPVLLVK
jgi:nucleotide-binding universal stress UspA family protein